MVSSQRWAVSGWARSVAGLGVTLALAGAAGLTVSGQGREWRDYAGGPDSSRFVAATGFTKDNVKQLEVAWTFPAGQTDFNALVVRGVVYGRGPEGSFVALDAATGKQLWSHTGVQGFNARGINYWESADGKARRLIFSSLNMLQEIDALTGETVSSFGKDGKVDLREGLDRDPAAVNQQTRTPGRVFDNLLILGSATNQEYTSAPGDIRAFDVRTGALVWTFHTVPRRGEFGDDTWPPEAWKTVGGANNWGEQSIDEKRGIVYIPTGSAKYNFYGGYRHGANLFGNSILALDVRTGKRLWHFQMVHHDIWDYDNATAPKLLTVQHEGKQVDVVAQVGKQGFIWVFDRVTGKPLWPIEERPVPASDVPGEETWPTQPFPLKPPPFARQKFTAEDLNPYLSKEDKARFRDQVLSARNEGLFTPPSRGGTIQMPGNNGGANWGGAAVDAEKGKLVVVSKDLPCLLKLGPDANDRLVSGFGFMTASDGLAAIAPPWTSLTAYDLNEGTIRWSIPLGDVPELAAKGILGTGTQYPKVGPVITAGGLVFTGTRDKKVRAFDLDTGKLVWEYQADVALEGIPAIYSVSGREYIVFCASAQAGLIPATQTPVHGAYIAFSLPVAH